MGSDWWCGYQDISCDCSLEDHRPVQAKYLSLQMMNPVSVVAYHLVTKPLNFMGPWIRGREFEDQPVHHAIEIRSLCKCPEGSYLLCEADGKGGRIRTGQHKKQRILMTCDLNEDYEMIRDLMIFADGFKYSYIGDQTCQNFAQEAWEIIKEYN